MRYMRTAMVLLSVLLVVTACDMTRRSGSSEDQDAAQQFFPRLPGYNVQQTDDLQNAIAAAMGGAAALGPGLPVTILIERVDSLIDCYREVGALDARVYIEQITLENIDVPTAGALAIINQDRLRENFFACVASTPLDGLFAQSAQPEPCYGYGSFTSAGGDNISFVFAGTDTPLCNSFAAHFNGLGANTTVTPLNLP